MKQGLRQGCVLAPLLFNIFFAAVINVASMRFKADKGIMDASIHLRNKMGAGCGGMQLPESQSWRRRFGVCSMLTMPGSSRNTQAAEEDDGEDRSRVRGFWPHRIGSKAEIMCLRARGMPESTAIFSVEAAGQMYNQTIKFAYLGGNVNHNAYAMHGAASGSTPSNCTTD